MRNFLLFITLSTCGVAQANQWTVQREVDSMTDREIKIAAVKNAAGHTLTVYRRSDNSAWATFRLPLGNSEVLAVDQYPVYRVDKQEPRNLEVLQKRALDFPGPVKPLLEPKWISFFLWDGKVSSGRSDMLIELSEGKLVVFRYFLFSGGFAETSFTLKGASDAIADALNISSDLTSGSLRHIEETNKAANDARKLLTEAIDAARKSCEANAVRVDFSVCYERVKRCAAQEQGSAQIFKSCIQ